MRSHCLCISKVLVGCKTLIQQQQNLSTSQVKLQKMNILYSLNQWRIGANLVTVEKRMYGRSKKCNTQMCCVMRKPLGFPTRPSTNWAVQPQNMLETCN